MSSPGHRPIRPPSGHVFRVNASAGRRGTPSTACPTVASAAPDRARLDAAGPSPAGYHDQARRPRRGCGRCSTRRSRGTLPGMVRTGATFADAAAEYLRYAEHDRA